MTKVKPTFDIYFSEVDDVCVVHIDTEGMPENNKGPILRVYINDDTDDLLWENPEYPGPLDHEHDYTTDGQHQNEYCKVCFRDRPCPT